MSSDPVCPTFRKIFIATVFGVCVFLIPDGVHSATSNSATLQWTANQESDLAGYLVYHGTTSGSYSNFQNSGMTTTYQYTNLESNKTHYFAVTAYDTSGNESPPSLEVSQAITGPDSILSISISGGGTVTSSPTGISCSTSTCSGTFPQGSSVTLTATPSSGATFVGWNGAGCSGNGSCVVTLTQAHTVTATFMTSLTALQVSTPLVLDGLTDEYAWSQANSVTFSNAQHSDNDVTVATLWDATNLYFAFTVTDAQLEFDAVSPYLYRDDGAELYLDTNHDETTSLDSNDYHYIVNYLDEATLSDISTATATSSTGFVMELGIPWATLNTTAVAGKVLGLLLGNNDRDNGSSAQFDNLGLIDSAGSYGNPSLWGDLVLSGQVVVAPPPVSHSLGVSLTGDGKGSVTSKPSGLNCSGGTCTASFPQGTIVTLTPATQSGTVFEGWNGVCSGTSNCVVTLTSAQTVTAVFTTENSNPPPMPDLPLLVNFQPSSSQVPTNFKKDDGSVFASIRGYGWNKLLHGTEKKSTADQTLDTYVSAANLNPGTWNFTIPNGTYYVTMVLGDPKNAQGPHWVEAEGLQLAKQVKTSKGEYLTIVDYPVEVNDTTLSIKLGNSGQGQTVVNYLMVNSAPNLPQTTQVLIQSFGTPLVTSVITSGSATKINPTMLAKKEKRKKEQEELAAAQEEQKKQEMAKLNRLKDKMASTRKSGGTVTLRNLLGGS